MRSLYLFHLYGFEPLVAKRKICTKAATFFRVNLPMCGQGLTCEDINFSFCTKLKVFGRVHLSILGTS